MCGRYRLSRRKQIIEEYFETSPWDDEWEPRYNIAPTQPVPVIRQHPKEPVRHLSLMKWGLIPSWAKEPSVAASTINARSETAATKPAFRDPLKFRRCLIPADGFYEWKKTGTSKQPFCFEVKDGELFAFAGLWDGWRDGNGNWVNLFNSDDHAKRRDFDSSRQDARDSRSRQLRSLARSGDAKRCSDFRTAEAIRRPFHALLPGEHPD